MKLNIKLDEKKRNILIGIIVLVIIFLISSGTLAFFRWQTSSEQQTEVVFTVEKAFTCSADGGGNITSQDVVIMPTNCMDSAHTIKREVKVMPDIISPNTAINLDLYMDVNSLGTGLKNSQNFNYALTTSSTSCTEGVVSSGNFNGKTTGNKIQLLDKDYNQTITDKYYLYIWLDAAETSQSTMNQSFNLSLSGQCEEVEEMSGGGPSNPVLDGGMIPVKIANDGTVTTVSSTDSSWYNYDNKEWANAVLVKYDNGIKTRSYYKSNPGVTVLEDDILAYFVWIPRYKYKIWSTSTDSVPQTIDIEFESKTANPVLGTTVDSWRTHPAFIWDDNTIAGIWVGKFETTGDATMPTIKPDKQFLFADNFEGVVQVNNTKDMIGNNSVIVLPNHSSSNFNIVGIAGDAAGGSPMVLYGQFITSLKFASGIFYDNDVSFEGSYEYGLSSNVDSHILKNSDWGAVTYLSHSKYGINANVASAELYDMNVGGGNSYGQLDIYPKSTTGNITGIFGMAGGVGEYVMANYGDSTANSGFTTMPPQKYYDKYTTENVLTACNGNVCFGHALSETFGWYNSYASLTLSGKQLRRGGSYSDYNPSLFIADNDDGWDMNKYGFRIALVIS